MFSHVVSNEDRQEQGYIDKREETVFGKRWGGTEKEARKLTLGYRLCKEGCGVQEKVIPGKAREFCCLKLFWLPEGYCKR